MKVSALWLVQMILAHSQAQMDRSANAILVIDRKVIWLMVGHAYLMLVEAGQEEAHADHLALVLMIFLEIPGYGETCEETDGGDCSAEPKCKECAQKAKECKQKARDSTKLFSMSNIMKVQVFNAIKVIGPIARLMSTAMCRKGWVRGFGIKRI